MPNNTGPMTKDNMVELKPCPFCGGEANGEGYMKYSRPLDDTQWADGSEITEAFFVNCIKCGIDNGRSGLVGGYQTKSEAIKQWNTRATMHGSDSGVTEAMIEAGLADLRDRRLLKYLFDAEPESCGAYGYVDQPLDLGVQREVVTAIYRAMSSASAPDSGATPRRGLRLEPAAPIVLEDENGIYSPPDSGTLREALVEARPYVEFDAMEGDFHAQTALTKIDAALNLSSETGEPQ